MAKWNPADHPRDPLGRFSLVGGSRTTSRLRPVSERKRGWSIFDEEPEAAASRDEIFGDSLDVITPSSVRERFGSKSEIPAGTGWGNMPPVRKSDAKEVSLAMRELQRMKRPPSYALPQRPDSWDEPDWRGVPPADVEADIIEATSPDFMMSPVGMQDLSSGGALNRGVRRGMMVDEDGRKLDTEVVIKGTRISHEADAEVLASELGHAIGAPMPIVRAHDDERTNLVMEAVPGEMGFAVRETATQRELGREGYTNYLRSAKRIAILDQLTGNRDRHDGNWILTDDGTAVGIDNGLAWGAPAGKYGETMTVNETRAEQENKRGRGNLAGGWYKIDDKHGPSLEEMESWRPKLQALEPVFAAHDQQRWFDDTMRNYEFLLHEKRSQS